MLSVVLSAELGPAPDLAQLVADADIIVLGTIAEVTDLEVSSIAGASVAPERSAERCMTKISPCERTRCAA